MVRASVRVWQSARPRNTPPPPPRPSFSEQRWTSRTMIALSTSVGTLVRRTPHTDVLPRRDARLPPGRGARALAVCAGARAAAAAAVAAVAARARHSRGHPAARHVEKEQVTTTRAYLGGSSDARRFFFGLWSFLDRGGGKRRTAARKGPHLCKQSRTRPYLYRSRALTGWPAFLARLRIFSADLLPRMPPPQWRRASSYLSR